MSNELTREEFNDVLGSLHKSSETSRAIFSTFFLIYAAVAMYALSAYVWPQEAERVHAMSQDLTRAIPCIFLDKADTATANCGKDHTNIIMHPVVFEQIKERVPPEQKRQYETLVREVNVRIYAHRLEKMLDASYEASLFSVPLAGVKIDRNLFGYMNAVAGIFFYCILLSALENQIMLLQFILPASTGSLLRMQMVNASQVFTASGRFVNHAGTHPDSLGKYLNLIVLPLKRVLFLCIIAAPLAVASTVEWDAGDIYTKSPMAAKLETTIIRHAGAAPQPVSSPGRVDPGTESSGSPTGGAAEDLQKLEINHTASLLVINILAMLAMAALMIRLTARVWRLFDIDIENMQMIEAFREHPNRSSDQDQNPAGLPSNAPIARGPA